LQRAGRFRVLLLPVLSRYALADLAATLVFAFAVVMGFMVLLTFLEAGRQAGIDSSALLSLAPHALPFGVKYALPLSLLLAVAFTFSRLGADNEITALRAAGATPWALAAPVLLLALALSMALLAVEMLWLPRAHIAKRKVLKEAGLKVLENLPAGEQSFQVGRVLVHYADARGPVLSGIVITEVRGVRLALRVSAAEGRWAFDREAGELRLELSESQWTWYGTREGTQQRVYPGAVSFRLNLDRQYPSWPRRVQDLTFEQLLGTLGVYRVLPPRMAQAFRWKLPELELELHARLAGALSPLIVALLGMPLGLWARQRGKLGAFFAAFLPVLALYYPLTFAGDGLGSKGGFPPAVAAWAADLLVGSLGGFLTWRMIAR
jgi:lipopolysaccharide export system permease protein